MAAERKLFHQVLMDTGILSVNPAGIPSNADKDSKPSVRYAQSIANSLQATTGARLAGQSSGGKFELACADFLLNTFPQFWHLRPGQWDIRQITGRGDNSGVSQYEQYSHLRALDAAVKGNRSLKASLGNAYAIAPDVVITRAPVEDEEINATGPAYDDGTYQPIVDESVSRRAALRAFRDTDLEPALGPALPILHAVVSCKWTLRSDRAQNARSEALNLIRNRKGRLPHIAVVTGEPTPTRISSLALGTGDIDCVYHFALPELQRATDAPGAEEGKELLEMMIEGKRLKDISDLPLDLAI